MEFACDMPTWPTPTFDNCWLCAIYAKCRVQARPAKVTLGGMTTQKPPSQSMSFIVEHLKKDQAASYADVRDAAAKKGITIYPIMYGRGQTLLGIGQSAKRGTGKVAQAKGASPSESVSVATPRQRGRQPDATSKSGQVRTLLAAGMSIPDIVKKVGCTAALAYNVKSRMGDAPKRGPGRPPKVRTVTTSANVGGIADIVALVQNGERERAKMRMAMERIQSVLAEVLA